MLFHNINTVCFLLLYILGFCPTLDERYYNQAYMIRQSMAMAKITRRTAVEIFYHYCSNSMPCIVNESLLKEPE